MNGEGERKRCILPSKRVKREFVPPISPTTIREEGEDMIPQQ
jgi:hypothetical protein